MALATKCPHCHTIFRVAADQLKLRGGIVRCGSCKEVFDGNAALTDAAAHAAQTAQTATPAHAAAPPKLDESAYAIDIELPDDPFDDLITPELDEEDLEQDLALDLDVDLELGGDTAGGAQHAFETPPSPAGERGSATDDAPRPPSENNVELEFKPNSRPAPETRPEFPSDPGFKPETGSAFRSEPDFRSEPGFRSEQDSRSAPAFDTEFKSESTLKSEFKSEPGLRSEYRSESGLRSDYRSEPEFEPSFLSDRELELELELELEPEPTIEPVPSPAPEPAPPSASVSTAAPALAAESDQKLAAESAQPAEPALAAQAEEKPKADKPEAEFALEPRSTPSTEPRFKIESGAPTDASDGRREPTFDIPDDEPSEYIVALSLPDYDGADEPPAAGAKSKGARIDMLVADEPSTDEPAAGAPDGEPALYAPAPGAAIPATPEVDEPGFVKQGRRRARIRKALRILMGFGSLLLLVALLAQALTTFRNQLAAQMPPLKPALESACAVIGCRVELPAQIDMLTVEQGELQTIAEHTFSYATVLHNQSGSAQAWPSLELTLNDGNDKPVLRRVVEPREYLPAAAEPEKGFAPRSEQAVKLYFELNKIKASGYHIAVFYP